MKRAALALSLCLLAPLAASGQEEDSAVSASEEIELDAIAITGNDELPRILAIVPWKAAEPGEVPGRPLDSLLNEVIAPIDRREYRRQLSYHEALHGETPESD
jgi:hypothetical protein